MSVTITATLPETTRLSNQVQWEMPLQAGSDPTPATPTLAPPGANQLPNHVQREKPPQAGRAEALQSQDSGGQVDVASHIEAVVKDADRIWTACLARIGDRNPYAVYHILGSDTTHNEEPIFTSRCPSVGAADQPVYTTVDINNPNAFYCMLNGNGQGGGLPPSCWVTTRVRLPSASPATGPAWPFKQRSSEDFAGSGTGGQEVS